MLLNAIEPLHIRLPQGDHRTVQDVYHARCGQEPCDRSAMVPLGIIRRGDPDHPVAAHLQQHAGQHHARPPWARRCGRPAATCGTARPAALPETPRITSPNIDPLRESTRHRRGLAEPGIAVMSNVPGQTKYRARGFPTSMSAEPPIKVNSRNFMAEYSLRPAAPDGDQEEHRARARAPRRGRTWRKSSAVKTPGHGRLQDQQPDEVLLRPQVPYVPRRRAPRPCREQAR